MGPGPLKSVAIEREQFVVSRRTGRVYYRDDYDVVWSIIQMPHDRDLPLRLQKVQILQPGEPWYVPE